MRSELLNPASLSLPAHPAHHHSVVQVVAAVKPTPKLFGATTASPHAWSLAARLAKPVGPKGKSPAAAVDPALPVFVSDPDSEPAPSDSCDACMEPFLSSPSILCMFKLGCKHRFCRSCLSTLFTTVCEQSVRFVPR